MLHWTTLIFYGLATWRAHSVEHWFLTLAEAEAALAQVLVDEPEFEGVVGLVRVDFSALDPVVEVIASS
jgi:hypothetical protein